MSNIFEDKTKEMPKESEQSSYCRPAFPGESSHRNFPAGCSVAVSMTPEQECNLRMSNYPRYDAMDVEHVRRPRFGHGY